MKYLCTGRVMPERVGVSFSQLQMNVDAGGIALLSCEASQLAVYLMDLPDVDGYITAAIRAREISDLVIGALGFSLACGYTVEITQVIEEDATAHVFGVGLGLDLNGNSMAFDPHDEVFINAAQLSGKDIFFRLAVKDYLRAIIEHNDCASYCYRAIEGIKSAFTPTADKSGWQLMHDSLGTNRKDIEDVVKSFADATRHGNWGKVKPTNGVQRMAMLSLTREILKRYLELKIPDLAFALQPDLAQQPDSQ